MSSQNSKSVESWELTAFALGELDQEHNQRIRTAVDSDAALAAELFEIQQTIGLVRNSLQSEDELSVVSLTGGGPKSAIPASAFEQNKLPPPSQVSQGKWIALLAMSASLLIAAVYSSGLLNDWLLVESPSTDSIGLKASDVGLKTEEREIQPQRQSTSKEMLESLEKNQSQIQDAFRGVVRSKNAEVADFDEAELSVSNTFAFEGSSPSRNLSSQDDVLFESTDLPSADIPNAGMGGSANGGGMGMGGMGMGGMGMGGMGMGEEMGMGGDTGLVTGLRSGGGYGMGASEVMAADSSSYRSRKSNEELSKRRLQPAESNSDRYQTFSENQFELVDKQPLSTFSIDVDTASYAKCRQLLLEAGRIPPASAVRLEEFVNYFDYDYAPPTGEHPFAPHLAVSNCPWQAEHKLVRVALQTAKPNLEERKPANVVFLIDVSGSMADANKLPLVKDAMRMMMERLTEKDRVAIVVYAGAAGCVLEGTPGNQHATILAALDRLQAGGSTNGGDGIQLAYQLARDQFIPGGNNRVVLCTDGDFNVGVTGTQQLVELVAQNAKSKIFITVLGFGMGNTNDAMMEQISNRGNGVYGFVDSWREAKRQMVDQLAGNLITVAKDVKIQVEFNPKHVKAYRLLGYENRMLAAKDFNDDTKDAGEIGAGHRVTAFYEVVPVGANTGVTSEVDDLLFQPKKSEDKSVANSEEKSALVDEFSDSMMAVKLRYKQPEGDVSQKFVVPLPNTSVRFQDIDRDFRWAASMVQFGMLLRHSQFAGSSTWSGLLEQAREAAGSNPDAQREEALQMMERASRMR